VVGRSAALLRADADPEWVDPGRGARLGRMDLEEKSLEHVSDRCEECGAKLTPQEIQAAMESGGPALCSIHADEVVPLGEDELDFGEE
jgi:hypothetical protein